MFAAANKTTSSPARPEPKFARTTTPHVNEVKKPSNAPMHTHVRPETKLHSVVSKPSLSDEFWKGVDEINELGVKTGNAIISGVNALNPITSLKHAMEASRRLDRRIMDGEIFTKEAAKDAALMF